MISIRVEMYTYNTEVKLHHTDAAGVLFFSHQLTLAHDAYQAFMETIGFPLSYFVTTAPYFLPIVHTESDYTRPLQIGQKLRISLGVSQVGRTSFILQYDIKTDTGVDCGRVQTVHVCMDRTTRKKTGLPDDLKEKLSAYLPAGD